ncbi:secreted protein [Beggiatoa sp. PS]|nr:secreted protein [Beggiatoa sp. PS]
MKKLRYCFFSTMVMSLLLVGKIAVAETEILNLSGYEEGDIPTHLLGEQITVRQEVKDGKTIKYVAGQGDEGIINYTIPNLSKDFEIVFELQLPSMISNRIFISFTADDEVKFNFNIDYNLQLGSNDGVNYSNTSWDNKSDAVNVLKLKVEGGNVKSYLNSEFFQSMVLEEPNRVYDQLKIIDIDPDVKIYSITVNNLDASPIPTGTPDDSSAGFESGKQAGIQQCVSDPASCGIITGEGDCAVTTDGAHASYNPVNGEVYIPFIDVPGPFGDPQVYEVYLIQQPSTFTFDLDPNRINLLQ